MLLKGGRNRQTVNAVLLFLRYDGTIDKPEDGSALSPARTLMNKPEILLFLFYRLLNGKPLNKSAFCCDMKLSERTFYRYLSDIRNFCTEFATGMEISADADGNYTLKRFCCKI